MRPEVRKDLKAEKLSVVVALCKIRDDESLSSIPVAMVTNSNLESDEQAAVKVGTDSFLYSHAQFDCFVI